MRARPSAPLDNPPQLRPPIHVQSQVSTEPCRRPDGGSSLAARSVPSFTMRAFWDELETRGVSEDDLTRRSGVPKPKAGDFLSTISLADTHRVYQAAAELSEDPTIGLEVARTMGLRSFHLLGHIALASSTMRQTLAVVRLVDPRLADQLPILEEVAPDRFRLGNRALCADPSVGLQVEAQLRASLIYDRALQLVNGRASLIRVQLPFPEPQNADAYHQAFSGGVEFDADGTFVVFPRTGWYRRQSGSDPALLKRLVRLAQEQYSVADTEERWSVRVRNYLRAHEAPRLVDAAVLAERLGTSTRSLSRRLAEEDVRLSVLMDDVLYERARSLLESPNATAAGVASALGYAELSSFFRAFRRWSGGLTPREYRRRIDP